MVSATWRILGALCVVAFGISTMTLKTGGEGDTTVERNPQEESQGDLYYEEDLKQQALLEKGYYLPYLPLNEPDEYDVTEITAVWNSVRFALDRFKSHYAKWWALQTIYADFRSRHAIDLKWLEKFLKKWQKNNPEYQKALGIVREGTKSQCGDLIASPNLLKVSELVNQHKHDICNDPDADSAVPKIGEILSGMDGQHAKWALLHLLRKECSKEGEDWDSSMGRYLTQFLEARTYLVKDMFKSAATCKIPSPLTCPKSGELLSHPVVVSGNEETGAMTVSWSSASQMAKENKELTFVPNKAMDELATSYKKYVNKQSVQFLFMDWTPTIIEGQKHSGRITASSDALWGKFLKHLGETYQMRLLLDPKKFSMQELSKEEIASHTIAWAFDKKWVVVVGMGGETGKNFQMDKKGKVKVQYEYNYRNSKWVSPEVMLKYQDDGEPVSKYPLMPEPVIVGDGQKIPEGVSDDEWNAIYDSIQDVKEFTPGRSYDKNSVLERSGEDAVLMVAPIVENNALADFIKDYERVTRGETSAPKEKFMA